MTTSAYTASISEIPPRARTLSVDPQAWLADVLARLADHPAQRLDELLPWHWAKPTAIPVDQAA